MSTSTNFAVGEPFPLPIRAEADGGMFQADKNGMMFLLQLSRTDAIAVEAFRTGEIELALSEVDGILFFLYRIDGIFKDGWGDAPLSLALVKEELMPDEKSLADPTIHLYLVDTKLKLLLAQRTARVRTSSDKTYAHKKVHRSRCLPSKRKSLPYGRRSPPRIFVPRHRRRIRCQ